MKTQHYKNHSRYSFTWHFAIPLVILASLVGSIVNLVNAESSNSYSAALILVIILLLIGFYVYTRWFALRAQDRAIRAEENLRHFILTGKPLDNRLSMSQIIALRFASDAEFPSLAIKAAEEKLTAKQVKQSIREWKPDYNRV